MLETLFDHISRYVELSEGDKQLLSDRLSIRDVRKKTHILSAGEICQANYFVLKGCFRMYFVKESGQEHTIQFGLENWWITDFASLENRRPTNLFIQAVEPSQIAIMTRENQEVLFGEIPQLERYFRLIAQRAFSASLLRIQYLFELSVESRYEQFNRLFPEFVQRIPQYMLASFLGFTPEVLSKIRAKRSR
jgi:CRP-like cAMP-binding protein